MTAKRFCLALFGLYALCLLAAAGLVYLVDPFNLLGRNWTGIYVASERQAKPRLLASGDYDALLLGSSKTTYIDPARLCLPGVFNASFPAATPEEMLEFLTRYLGDQRIVLIGLDLFMFNEREVPLRGPAFEDDDPARILGYLLGWKPADRSLLTLVRYWRGQQPFLRPNGSRTAVAQLARHERMTAPDHDAALDYLMANHYRDFRFSSARLRVLEQLRELLRSRGVEYRVFINPVSDTILEQLRGDPAWRQHQHLRAELRRIFPGLIDLSESRWSDVRHYFRFDPLHYLPDAGADAMNETVLCGLCRDEAGLPPHCPAPGGLTTSAVPGTTPTT